MLDCYLVYRCVFAELTKRNCNTGEIRLTGWYNNTGRVEICNEGRWGTVCVDSWDWRDARVACRQLGHSVDKATAIIFSLGSGEIWLHDVRCTGTETRLIDCPAGPLGTHNCLHVEDAGVSCLTAGESMSSMMMLFMYCMSLQNVILEKSG